MEFTTLVTEVRDRVMYVTLNRPQSLNAVNRTMHSELEHLFKDLPERSDVDVISLRGSGRAFCVGGDIKEMQSGELTGLGDGGTGVITTSAARLVRNLLSVPQPIVAVVNGDAIGLGATLALLCDVVFAAETPRFGDPRVRLGLVASDGGAVVWPLLMSINRAKEYLMTGKLVSAAEAARLGLVNHVWAAGELDVESEKLIRSLADGPSQAMRWTKQAINTLLWDGVNSVLDLSLSLEALSAGLPAHREGVLAFLERRSPRFH